MLVFLLLFHLSIKLSVNKKVLIFILNIEENKKLEAIMNVFKELSYDEKREKVISLVEWLGEEEVYWKTLSILKEFQPSDQYLNNLYRVIMENKLSTYEEWQVKEKQEAQQKMHDYMWRLNELSQQKRQEDEKEADELLSMIE